MKKGLMEEIIVIEWEMMQKVKNIGGRSFCQEDPKTFEIMRKSQYVTWPNDVLESYLDDLKTSKQTQRNLLMEKYARMMASSHPREYEEFKDILPSISSETVAQIEKIVTAHVIWKKSVEQEYPKLSDHGRPLTSDQDSPSVTSFETYMRGELQSYSANTVAAYCRYIEKCLQTGRNLAKENLLNMMQSYGFQSLEEAEAVLNEHTRSAGPTGGADKHIIASGTTSGTDAEVGGKTKADTLE